MIYLASPYTHDDPEVKQTRAHLAAYAASMLMEDGMFVFSPISHTHPIAFFGLPGDWTFWEQYDRQFLDWCEEMIVLRIKGWEESRGIKAEIEIVKELGKPIRYMDLIGKRYKLTDYVKLTLPNE